MAKNKGYVSIYRNLMDHWIWDSDERFDRRSAWIDLILRANYKPRTIDVGQLVTVDCGELWTSTTKLQERWHWARNTVVKFLKKLESDGMIERKMATNRGTLIRIVNYPYYQGKMGLQSTSSDTPNDTQHDTQKVRSVNTNNKVNKDNKENKENKTLTLDGDEFEI